MKKLLIITILFYTNSLIAEDSIFLKKGESAPFSAFLVPEEKVKELYNSDLQLNMYKTTNDLKDQQITLLTVQNTSLTNTLKDTSTLSTWEKVGYFCAGILVTGLAIDAASKIISH